MPGGAEMLRSLTRERRRLLVDLIELRSVQICPLEVIAEDLPVLGGSVPCLSFGMDS